MLSIGFTRFVDKRRYNGGSCLHVLAHNQIFPSGLYNKSWFPPCIGGLSACMGNVVHSTYTTGTRALPDIYARALGQAKHSSLWYKYNILYGLLSPVNGLLTWSQKDKQIYKHTNIHAHTLFGKQFQETRCTPTARHRLAVGAHLV